MNAFNFLANDRIWIKRVFGMGLAMGRLCYLMAHNFFRNRSETLKFKQRSPTFGHTAYIDIRCHDGHHYSRALGVEERI